MKKISILMGCLFFGYAFMLADQDEVPSLSILPVLSDISTYPSGLSCPSFNKRQKAYHAIMELQFLGPIGIRYHTPYEETQPLRDYFLNLAKSEPKNRIQRSIFPYANGKYASNGEGIEIFCEDQKDVFYQMGTVEFKGYAKMDGEVLSFVINSSPDENWMKLPYIQTDIEGKSSVSLGCAMPYGPDDPVYFRGPSLIVEPSTNLYRSTIGFGLHNYEVDIFKKSIKNPEKEITIHAELIPNVVFSHEVPLFLDDSCENSRIQKVIIVDDGGL